MASYNRKPAVGAYTAKAPVAVKAPTGPIGTKKSGKPAVTFEGHDGFERKNKSALFLLAAASLGGEDKFYEPGNVGTQRLVALVRKVAVKDAEWTAEFLSWLRSEGNIRTASVVGGVEAADAMVKAGIPGGRQIVNSVLQRADEPGEAMAYWEKTRPPIENKDGTFTRVLMPKAIKRGIADGAERLYTEFSFMKYDSDRSAVRFGDVIQMVRPNPSQGWKSDLFRHAIEKRHGWDVEPAESLNMIRAQKELRRRFEDAPRIILQQDNLRAAGMTWEDVLSLGGSKLDKAEMWKAILPNLGIMALIRNIRNLDEAGVSDEDVAPAIARLMDPEQIARSRQLPYRFYTAYKNAPSLRWGHALEVALGLSLKNIPELGGRTLILCDTSQSMTQRLSDKSQMTYQEYAGLFGVALGLRNEADVYMWADRPLYFPMAKGSSVLKNLEHYMSQNGKVGYGTDLAAAIRGSYEPGKYARMVVISDMQVRRYGRSVIPTDIPIHLFNLAGYAAAIAETKDNVYELGGLTDHTFKMIKMLEAGESGKWPWQ